MTTDQPNKPDTDAQTDEAFADYDTAQFRAQAAITQGIARIVARTSGPDGFESRPMYVGDPWPHQQPRPEPALHAALLLRNSAEAALRQLVVTARSDGTSWDRTAVLLGIDDIAHDLSPGERAFFVVAPERPESVYPPAVSWRCSTCRELVTDRGPFESHPSDNEAGHANDCVRHQADIERYLRRMHAE